MAIFYEFLALCCVCGFAAYDLFYRRVPDRALAFFCPMAFAAPMIYAGLPFSLEAFFNAFCLSLSGFAAAFLILLATALASKNGTGIGGGDIKLAALLGWVYGAARIIPVLLLSAGLASIVSLIIRRKARDSPLSLPFVPFLAVGCLTVTITTIFQF